MRLDKRPYAILFLIMVFIYLAPIPNFKWAILFVILFNYAALKFDNHTGSLFILSFLITIVLLVCGLLIMLLALRPAE